MLLNWYRNLNDFKAYIQIIFKKYFLVLWANQVYSTKNINAHVPWTKWPPSEDIPMNEIFQLENAYGQICKSKQNIF